MSKQPIPRHTGPLAAHLVRNVTGADHEDEVDGAGARGDAVDFLEAILLGLAEV